MRSLAQRLHSNDNFIKAKEWGRLVSVTGGGQIIVQITSLISGILIIRLLPIKEYALYTLVNTMLGTMTVLADGGISAGVMAQGGQVWQDREKLGVVLVTGLNLRKRFATVSLLIAIPALLYLLLHHGASLLTSCLIILSLVPAFYASLSDTLLEIAPKLRQDIVPLQKNQVESNLGRLALTGISVFVFPWAYVAVLAGGLPRIWSNIRLRKISAPYADWNQSSDVKVESKVIAFVRRILPGSIYYCVSGQITTWLISIFGSTNAVAQIGALGRLAVMLSFFSVLFSTLIVPRFARLPANKIILLKRYTQIQILLIAISLCILTAVWRFPSELLWILGKNYSNLQTELLLSVAVSCVGLISGSSFNLSTSRSWAINPLISIPITLAAIAFGAVFINIASLKGILSFNLFVASVEVVMYISYCLIKIFKIND